MLQGIFFLHICFKKKMFSIMNVLFSDFFFKIFYLKSGQHCFFSLTCSCFCLNASSRSYNVHTTNFFLHLPFLTWYIFLHFTMWIFFLTDIYLSPFSLPIFLVLFPSDFFSTTTITCLQIMTLITPDGVEEISSNFQINTWF